MDSVNSSFNPSQAFLDFMGNAVTVVDGFNIEVEILPFKMGLRIIVDLECIPAEVEVVRLPLVLQLV